jgi:hypothetical protein
MQYRPPQRRRGLIPPWLMSAAIILITLVAAWLAGPRNQTGVIVTGAIVLLGYLGFVYWVRRRSRDDVDQ